MPLGDYRSEFVAALWLLARALADYCESGRERPVLVGGAAVDYYTVGQYQTGDLDIAEADHEAFSRAILGVGFRTFARKTGTDESFAASIVPS